MEIETHIYLADQIYESLQPVFPIVISPDLFRKANVIPDQKRNSIIHPHFPGCSYKFIERQATFLSGEHLHIGEKMPLDFVMRLGQITHYLCDFFCHVHIMNSPLRFIEHIDYESRLNKAISDNRSYFDEICHATPIKALYSSPRLKLLYEQCKHQYLQHPIGFDRDMKIASWISVQVASNILDQCIKNTKPDAIKLSS